MITRMPWRVLTVLACLGGLAYADTASRIAVIGDTDDQNLAALVTTELTGHPNIVLVERDDLAKAGDELKLQQLAGSDAVALGKLLGADGLIFIDKRPDGVEVRFTAVGLGYALFDDHIAADAKLPEEAKSIAHRVVNYTPKLKLDPAKAIPISVLNLRADYATSDSTALERKLTLLLENRLSAQSQYVVLERRHAWSLSFEHSLNPASPSFLRGAYVIDGTLSAVGQDSAQATVHLRVRTPAGREVASVCQGLPADLVDAIVAQVNKTTGGAAIAPDSSVDNEAREYLNEGIWGLQHNSNEAALEALDSSELLGGNIADITAARILVLANLLNTGLERWYPKITDEYEPTIDASELAQKTDMAIREIHEAVRYRDEKLESRLQAYTSAGDELKYNVTTHSEEEKALYPICKVLVLLEQANSPHTDELRRALRSLTGYDPLRGQPAEGFGTRLSSGDCSRVFADDWAETFEEELAYYKLICTDRQVVLPDITERPDDRFCARLFKTPSERRQAFEAFVESLKEKADAHMTYLFFKTHSTDLAGADSAYLEIIAELWSKRAELLATTNYTPLMVNLQVVSEDARTRKGAAALPLLHYYLTTAKQRSYNIKLLQLLWHPQAFPDTEAPQLWKEFSDYRQLIEAQLKGGDLFNFDNDMDQMTIPFKVRFAQLVTLPALPATPPTDALVATKFWYPWMSIGSPASCDANIMDIDKKGPWICSYLNVPHETDLYHLNLDDFSTQSIPNPGNHIPENLKATPQAVFMTWETTSNGFSDTRPHAMGRFDLATSTWTVHAMPEYAACHLFCLGDSLYMFLGIGRSQDESAVTRYDWDQDKLTILSSTRRRPAQNQFDDRPRMQYGQIFLGPGRRPCLTTFEGTYYLQDIPGTWPEVFDSSFNNQTLTTLGKTLVLDQRGEAVLLDPGHAEPEYWMAPSQPQERKLGSPGHPSVKEMAPWADKTLFRSPGQKSMWYTQTCFYGDRLFILNKPAIKGGDYDLLCYEKGKGKDPRHIPLRFHLDDKSREALSHIPSGLPATWDINQIDHPDTTIYPSSDVQFYAAKQGLCIVPHNVGFWFLPYNDLDAYLKSHPSPVATNGTP